MLRVLKILVFILVSSLAVEGQIYTKPNNSYGLILNRIEPDSTSLIPTFCGAPTGKASLHGRDQKMSALCFDSCGHKFYVFDPADSSWTKLGATQLNDTTFIVGRDTIQIHGTGGGGGTSLINASGSGDSLFVSPNKIKKLDHDANITFSINSNKILMGIDTLSHIATKHDVAVGGSGEVNTASNQGSGVGVFKTKSAVDLQFKSITTPGSITATSNTNDVALQLSGDNATPGTNKVYGTNSSGTKGYQSAAVLNLTSPVDGQILVYSSGEWVNVDNNPVIPETQTAFKVGTSGMATGDSVYTDGSLIGKRIKVYREGERMYVDNIYGIDSDTSTGTITFHPYVLTGEKIIIEAGNYSTNTPIATLEDLDFPTATNLTHTGTTWSATNGTTIYAGYGLCNKKLASGTDGYIRARYTSSDGDAALIAFNTSNTSQPYADNPASPSVYYYEACGFLAGGTLYYFDNGGGATSSGYSLSVGDYWRIIRTGSTLKLQTSPDASTWTDRHTFTFSSTADLFINANIDANTGSHKLYEPKGYNLQ